jgi:peptide deformylase
VKRPDSVTFRFLDRNFTERKAEYSGWLSRVVQHEYDHLQGTLFLDHLSAFRRRLHKSALQKIDSGLIETDYPLVSKVLSKSS